MIKSFQRFAAALVAGGLMASATVFMAPPAAALGASCTAVKQTREEMGLDSHRARVICTWIASDTKVRAKLVRDGAKDYTSSWFTTTNKYYYTGWATCYAGCHAVYEVAPR
jgi:regulator of RNase E activity RraB